MSCFCSSTLDDANHRDHAGVRFPPPFMHGIGILSGFGLSVWHPWFLPHAQWLMFPGVLLLVAGVLLAGSAFREFRRAANPVAPRHPIGELMTAGPFRHTRNPLYLTLALLHGGIALVLGNAWLLLSLLPVLVVIRYHVIAREEAYLSRRFGSAYREYQRQVRRWF
ncbi:methyltransferase family protein [Thiolapillus sp.]